MLKSRYGDHLPIFPCLDYAPLSEERIESVCERLVDRADKELSSGRATIGEYDYWSAALDDWCEEQYDKLGGAQ